ncbi:hypothetical protein FY557_03435 [Chryseobacterium sp. SN22]|uniref:hypothetical protein n=1 Tax=Chryseobacterium sp. SN22 TaxID=2606431 RepID=UPI0011ED2DD2|nr:hypothetical protein [Chryseobacterium sp. SN22]KAA0129777.1 hypothetical protein FY557_03435 [Chryseobacterium sp. SN22]
MKALPLISLYNLRLFFKHTYFKYILAIIMILGFFMIPNPKSDYVTFTVGNYTGASNLIWISNLTPVYINAIFALLSLFISQNLKNREMANHTYINFRLSVKSNFRLLMYRVVSLFLYLTILAFILEIIILFINYQSYNVILYLIPFIYFTVPYLFFLSAVCTVIDYLVDLKFLKYVLYFGFIIFVYNTDIRHLLDITGIQELMDNFLQVNTKNNDSFILGKIKNKDVQYINFQHFITPKKWIDKLYLFPLAFIIVLSASFLFKRYSSVKNKEQNQSPVKKEAKPSFVQQAVYLPKYPVYSFSFISLLKAECFLLSHSLSRNLRLTAFVLWVLAFVAQGNIRILLIASIFITILPLNQNYLAGKYTNNTLYAEKISGYPPLLFILSKFLLFLVYIVIVIPVLDYSSFEVNLFILIKLLFLFLFQLAYTAFVKDYLMVEIIMIIIFSSYFSGVPVYQIF